MILESVKKNKEKYLSFNVKINVMLAGVINKDGKKVHEIIQLQYKDSCRFMASSLDKLAFKMIINVNNLRLTTFESFTREKKSLRF